MKNDASPVCPLCPSEFQTLWHLLKDCIHANSFWNRFQEWYSISSNPKLLLSELEVMFGIIRYHTYCLALNHLLIFGEYFLYVNALNILIYKFDDFILRVREKINIEKYIAVTGGRGRLQGKLSTISVTSRYVSRIFKMAGIFVVRYFCKRC